MTELNLLKLGQLKEDFPTMKPGDTLRVSEKILEKSKKKSQIFEGILISKKHGNGINATFTLRSIVGGVGVEKTYVLHSPLIEEIKIVKKAKGRRAKLYYLREKTMRKTRKKLKSHVVQEQQQKPKETQKEEKQTKKPAAKKEEASSAQSVKKEIKAVKKEEKKSPAKKEEVKKEDKPAEKKND
jgi:large subunit ribosomal protein L19